MAVDLIPAPNRERARAMLPLARTVLRDWIRGTSDGFGGVGQNAIGLATDAATRLSHPSPAGTQGVLAEVEALANGLGTPPRRRWWSAERPAHAPAEGQFAALAERIDRQRDETLRALIALTGDRARFVAALTALDDALGLSAALGTAIEAARREVRGDDPALARRLAEVALPALLDRQRDLLTQQAVTQQGLMTLDLLHANQTALGGALERARTATLSALQIAVAARGAVAGAQVQGAVVAQQAEALAQVAGAADGTEHARRMLADAVAQARRAIAGTDGVAQ